MEKDERRNSELIENCREESLQKKQYHNSGYSETSVAGGRGQLDGFRHCQQLWFGLKVSNTSKSQNVQPLVKANEASDSPGR